MSFGIDTFIVAGFLLTTLIVGLGQASKITTLKEYAIGNRNFSTGALVATLAASFLGGGGFFTDLSRTYSDGLYYVIPKCGMAFSFIILAYIFVPRMGEFLGKTSIAEAMGELYGQNVRIISAIAGIVGSVGFIAIQFRVFGSIVSYFGDFTALEGIILSATIVTLYSALGGIRAVTFTDVFQFFVFGLAIPIIGVMIWNNAYSDGFSLIKSTQVEKFNLAEVFNSSNPGFLSMITLLFYFALPGMEPEIFQRISMGRNVKQVKKAFIICACLILAINITTQWIPFLLFNVDKSLDSNNLFSYMIENYTFMGFKGLVITGIIAMAMSTSDSLINSCSVLFANDICKPMRIGISNELLISKIFSLFLGIGGVILALYGKDLLDIVLTASSFYMPIVTVPVMLTILGFRSSTKSVLIGMAAGGTTVFIWELIGIDADGIAFAMLINLIFLVGSHYLLKQDGGWVGIKDEASLIEMREEDARKQEEKAKLAENFTFVNFCKEHSPVDEISYTGLGVYLIIYTITTMYTTQAELLKENSRVILTIYQIMMVSGVVFIMYPMWPNSFDKKRRETVAQVLWPIVILFTLVIFNSFFAIIQDFSGLQLSVFTVNLLITSLLLGWRLSSITIFIGFLFGAALQHHYNPELVLDVNVGSPGFVMTYVLMLVGATMIIFIKPQQKQLEATEERVNELETETAALKRENGHAKREIMNMAEGVEYFHAQLGKEKEESSAKTKKLTATIRELRNELLEVDNLKDEFLRNLQHESNTPLTAVISKSNILFDSYDSLDSDTIKASIKDIINGSERLQSYVSNLVDTSKLTENAGSKLDKVMRINLSKLVEERTHSFKKVFSDDKNKPRFKLDIEPDLMVECNEHYITQLLDNLISNADKYGENSVIEISLSKMNSIMVEFKITDHGIGIPKNEVYDIFKIFTNSSRTRSQAEGRGLGLALCQKVVEAHQGKIIAESDGEKGATFTFVIPFNYHFKGVKI